MTKAQKETPLFPVIQIEVGTVISLIHLFLSNYKGYNGYLSNLNHYEILYILGLDILQMT